MEYVPTIRHTHRGYLCSYSPPHDKTAVWISRFSGLLFVVIYFMMTCNQAHWIPNVPFNQAQHNFYSSVELFFIYKSRSLSTLFASIPPFLIVFFPQSQKCYILNVSDIPTAGSVLRCSYLAPKLATSSAIYLAWFRYVWWSRASKQPTSRR